MPVDVQALAAGIALDWAREQAWLAEHAPPEPPPRRRRGFFASASFSDEDVLLTISPSVYVEALADVEVPYHGGMLSCPLPDHEDGTPSFRAYSDAGDGWYCWGCGRGGSIYDFGAALWGLSTRGSGFRELRQRLADELLRRAA
jgi:hypothetical protein